MFLFWSLFCVLCTQCCQCLWIVHSLLPLWFSLTLIYTKMFSNFRNYEFVFDLLKYLITIIITYWNEHNHMKEIFKNAKEVIRSRKSKRKYNRLAKRAQEHTMKYIALRTQIKNWATRTQEEFEDTNGVIRIRISKKNRQHNGQKKKLQKDKQRSTKHTHKANVTDLIDVIIYYIII